MTTTLNTFANAMPFYQVDASGNIISGSGGGSSTSDPSTGTNQTSGSQKTQVVDSTGNAIPFANAANQTAGNSILSGITAQLPASLGAKATAASLSVGFATDALLPIQGNVASGAADSGNPIKLGGVLPGGTNRININSCALAPNFVTSTATALMVAATLTGSVAGNTYAINPVDNRGDGIGSGIVYGIGNANVPTVSFNEVYNGATWDRQRGDVTGSWVHAPVNTVSTSLSGTISTSGGTATVAFVSTARQEILNPSTATIWASWGASPAVNGAGSFPIAVGGSFSTDRTNGTLTLLSTVATQPYTVNRYA